MSKTVKTRRVDFLFVLPLAAVIVVAFDIPMVIMLARSFTDPETGFDQYARMLNEPVYLKVLGNTLRIAAITTLICVLIGYPLAYWMRGLSPRGRIIAATCVVLPFWVSILVRTYAWIVLLGNNGVVNRGFITMGLVGSPIAFLYNNIGVIIGTANVLLPFLVLPLMAAMIRIDERLLQAASSLGASGRQAFWRVFFPLSVPALAAGAILVFILTLGFFVTPAILGGGRVPMLAPMLDTLINKYPQWGLAAAISVLLLAVTLVLYAFYRRASRGQEQLER